MVVFIKQRSHALFLVRGIESVIRNFIDFDWRFIKRPKHRSNVTPVIDPGAQPGQVSARHKFTRHLGVRWRQRLKKVEYAIVANGPGNQHQTEGQRKDRPQKRSAGKFEQKLLLSAWWWRLARSLQRSRNQRDTDRRGKKSTV